MNTNTCTPSIKTTNTIQIIVTSWNIKYSVDTYLTCRVMQVDCGIATSKALKGLSRPNINFTSVHIAVHADFSSAVCFLIRVIVYEILLDMLFIA